MSEKLVIVSDMWGSKKGLWITSYLGYLQQYFDITYHDSQELANLDVIVNTKENLHRAFVEGGIDTAATHLLKKEEEPAHYLGFSTGGTIAWKAGLMGLPMKSLYTVSSTRIRAEIEKPDCAINAIFGDNDMYRPKADWYKKQNLNSDIVKGFGHEMYTDEKVIDKVCLALLKSVTQKSKNHKPQAFQVA